MQIRALCVSLFFVLPGSLLAQDTPFRAGQWAAQFTGGSFSSLGLVKFRSPTRALVFDLQVGGSHREHFTNDTVVSVSSNAGIDVRVGRRSYRAVTEKVVGQHSLGVAVAFSHSVGTSPSFGTATTDDLQAGPFAELGAVYLITPHFGVGATGSVSVTYGRHWSKGPGGINGHSWLLGGDTGIAFSLTLFF